MNRHRLFLQCLKGRDEIESVHAEKSRREGLLALEDELDQAKIDERDIFEYGLRFVVDGIHSELIEKILSNLIKQEKDEDIIILKTIQKEAVLGIQDGTSPRMLYALLNSYVNITTKEDETRNLMEGLKY
jgi:flagellar motor component MotA